MTATKEKCILLNINSMTRCVNSRRRCAVIIRSLTKGTFAECKHYEEMRVSLHTRRWLLNNLGKRRKPKKDQTVLHP